RRRTAARQSEQRDGTNRSERIRSHISSVLSLFIFHLAFIVGPLRGSEMTNSEMENEIWKMPSAHCLLLTAHCLRSLLYILMQQLQLIPLFTQLHAQEIAHRKHPDPLFAIDDGQVPAADLFHSFQGLMRSLVTTNHRAQRTGHLTKFHR